MYKFFTLSVFALIINFTALHASTRDSIGVENYHGKKLILHQIVAKDNYYSVGRRYNVSPKDIMSFNDNKFLQIGIIIKVPTNIPFSGTGSAVSPKSSSSVTESTNETRDGSLIEHTVQKKENLNMLAEKYGTTVNEIKRINNLRSINLQIGQVLKIPVTAGPEESLESIASKPVKPEENVKVPVTVISTVDFLEHIVASNETIYSIATTYSMTMDQLKAKNNLTNNQLQVGQKLLIKGQYPVKPAYVPPVSTSVLDSVDSLRDPSLRYPPSRYGLNQVDEKGTAVWIADQDLDPTKMLVLHRSAPIGTVMKITNPMSNRTTFAKVVGKFTENESTKDVIIVMTKAVADALGALDKRFYCNLTYGGQDNEQK